MRDLDVRQAVRRKLDLLHADDEDTRVIEEMGIWSATARIDIAVVNGELCGFELKSAKDNLKRLPHQEQLYSQVFDRVTLVTAENHLVESLTIIPEWWGLSVAVMTSGLVRLSAERDAQENPQLRPPTLARLLWRDEALTILERHGLDRGYRSKPAAILHDRLAAELRLNDLRTEVRSALKARVYN